MRTRPTHARFARLALLLSISAAVALLAAQAPLGADAAQSGIRYDELMIAGMSGQPTPQPSGFSDRFQAAVNAMRPSHHGLFSGIMNAAQMMQSMTKTGMPTTHYSLGEWSRTDDPVKQTATIYRPDRHQIIHLDLAKKTYTIEDMSSKMGTPEPTMPNPQSGPPASPQPGSGKLDISDSTQSLAGMTLDGNPTSGYTSDFKMVSSQSTGSCKDGTIEATVVQYLSSFSGSRGGASMASMFTNPSPAMMAQQGGCQPKISYHHATSVTAPSDRLALWTLMTFKGSAGTGQPGGAFSTLVERGDVQTLGPGDAGLFDVPAGFTQGS